MQNPFDSDGTYLVLINDEEQYSLWPSFCAVPDGWTIAREESSRQDCLDYINATWVDMRPRSLRESMQSRPS
jgi:MbtH protein